MRLIGDMSSIMWTCLQAGKDGEGYTVEHNGRRVQVNTAGYGYENVVNSIGALMARYDLTPVDFVMVFEGRDSKKRRCMIDPTYKANREGDKDSRPPEAYVEFNHLKDLVRDTYKNLGAIAVSQPFVEGDDVIAYLVENLEEDCVVQTRDNDLAVLNGVNKYGSKCVVDIDGEPGINKYGPFEYKLITLYKALVGDSSDNVKGVKGFGEKAFMALNVNYDDDGCAELLHLMRQGRRNDAAEIAEENKCKILGKIVEHWSDALRSLKLVELHPEWVNTIKQPLEWDAGMLRNMTTDERLTKWAAKGVLVTAKNYEKSYQRLQALMVETLETAFDIETSAPEEADDWLQAMGKGDGVDQLGQETLAGFTINFGRNKQYSYYVSVGHADTENITMAQARRLIELTFGKPILVANAMFELSVMYANFKDEDGTPWRTTWSQYGEYGMMPGVIDIQLEASYVDENRPLGLKFRSKHHLGYDQQTYDETTLLDDRRFPGGSEQIGKDGVARWRYKMHELPARHVAGYGSDDGVVTSALHNLYHLRMQLEHHYKVALDVEINALYQHAKNFVDGATLDMGKLKQLEAEDRALYDSNWATLRQYLMSHGWEGTVPPDYSTGLDAKAIKLAYSIVTGISADADTDDDEEAAEIETVKDPVLSSRVRTPAKLAELVRAQGEEVLAELILEAVAGRYQPLQDYVLARFTGEPKFKFSNKQMCHLLYDVMQLPVRVRGKPTAKMKASGIREGNPKADDLALAYARRDAAEDETKLQILEAIKLLKMVQTRQGLYYNTYPYFVHWKTGKIHSSHRQCATNTRRAASATPNLQQQPKHAKVEGYPARFREVIVPHKRNAVVLSMDFNSQELRVIADYSQDANMLACYVGDNKKDMHCLTGAGILKKSKANRDNWQAAMLLLTPEQLQADVSEQEYQAFIALEHGTKAQQALYKQFRALGKKVNFTTEYGAQAPKLAATLLVDEDEAQMYIDAREDAFPQAKKWKREVIEEALSQGFVTTMLGARRHLAEALNSDDRFTASKAERQAVNFKIQGSSAEMTKKAEGRMWREGLTYRFDACIIGPIHDEVVSSVTLDDLVPFMRAKHAAMVAPYANMQVPIMSSISFGPNFGVQIEAGMVVDSLEMVEALRELLETTGMHSDKLLADIAAIEAACAA